MHLLIFFTTIKSQRYAHLVKPFEGDSSEYKEWLRSIEKYAILAEANEADLRRLAIAMSRGVANDFIQCYAAAYPDSSWDEMREALSQRFAPLSDPHHAFVLRRKLGQEPRKSARMLSQRLIDLAEVGRPPELSSIGDGKPSLNGKEQ